MSRTGPRDTVVGIPVAQRMLGRGRATIYKRLDAGDLERGTDAQGRSGVTLASILRYLENPPPGAWRAGAEKSASSDDFAALQAENLKLREVIARLQMARADEEVAQRHEDAAARHLRKAIREQARAAKRRRQASAHSDELLTLFLTPDDPSGAEYP